jgi:hypothetical protein
MGRHAVAHSVMRLALALILLAGCGNHLQPGVVPSLAALPDDSQRRNDVLDSSNLRRKQEGQTPADKKLYKVETAAASVAAVLGIFFSASPNAIVGMTATVEVPPPPLFAPKRPLSQPFIGPPAPPPPTR